MDSVPHGAAAVCSVFPCVVFMAVCVLSVTGCLKKKKKNTNLNVSKMLLQKWLKIEQKLIVKLLKTKQKLAERFVQKMLKVAANFYPVSSTDIWP